jgi:regulator of nucleoside diphosphate kinase
MLNTIQVTTFDMNRLFAMIDQLRKSGFRETANLDQLEEELARSDEVPPDEVAADVVTMNSRVRLQKESTGQEIVCSLVFPAEADASANKISIVAPLGIAILGFRVGDTVAWPMPGGVQKYKIVEIAYQPEAAGDFHL